MICIDNLEVVRTIEDRSHFIYSISFLSDGRLVSGDYRRVVVYNKQSFEADFIIEDSVHSSKVCGLKNGNLASGDSDCLNIYEIDGSNYKRIHTFRRDNFALMKIIELEDGKICICSDSSYDYKTIIILDNKNNYECFKIIEDKDDHVSSILEMEDGVVSLHDHCMKMWSKPTFQCATTLEGVYCHHSGAAGKLKENRVIVGAIKKVFIVDTSSFELQSFTDDQLDIVMHVCVLREDRVLLGNRHKRILCYDSVSNQITFVQKLHHLSGISCIIKSEDDKIFFSFFNGVIEAYHLPSVIKDVKYILKYLYSQNQFI